MATVNFNFSDINGKAYNGYMTVTPISITSDNNYIYVGDSISKSVNGGNISLSLNPNTYLIAILANLNKSEFYITVPSGSGTYNASDIFLSR